MEEFKSYLLSRQMVTEKKVVFYLHWVARFYSFCSKQLGEEVHQEEIDGFLNQLSKQKEEWQVKQASEAVQLFLFYKKRKVDKKTQTNSKMENQWNSASDDMVRMLRLKHLAYRTEQSYMGWLKAFQRFCRNNSPYEIDGSHVKNFLTHLAVERKIAASTQNQAFNAILFFYRNVLDKEIGAIAGAIRASKKRRLPVVLTKREINGLLEHLDGINHLMARLIYGCGLRIRECLQLRVKDIDFERSCVTIRGKGDKDRITILPESLKPDLRLYLESVRNFYEKDRENKLPGVQMPGALDRKYPNAGKEWIWYWVFPSKSLSMDPRSRIIRRHHIHPSNLQRQIKTATTKAGIAKRVTVHTLRHYAEFQIMPSCYPMSVFSPLVLCKTPIDHSA